jgi:DNA-binding MarR family transcriptional regulator
LGENAAVTQTKPEQDHIDAFLVGLEDRLPGLDLEIEGIVDRINGLARRIHRMLDDTLAEQGLSHGEWSLLGKLHCAPEQRRSPGELVTMLDLSSGAMTNRLDRLEQAGLVRRLPDPTDRRSIQVELTDAGRTRYQESVAAQAAKEAIVGAALGPEEQVQLNALLRCLMIEFERDSRYGKT